MRIRIGINVETGKPVFLDGDTMIDQKVLIEGNSRSGKSRGGRTLAENANGKYHQIIISPKREFVTLREKFDYIHVGRSSELSRPDIELNTRYAEQLALDIMKSRVDTIIEFSETTKERVKFVKNFVEGLMTVPQQYWHQTIIIIDEIDVFAPEKGHGDAESLYAIVDLAARGADKGYCLIAITQKLSKFNKDVASELNIKFVGNVSLDIDQTRAANDLGIPLKQKKVLSTLGSPNYHFLCYGPGLSDDVIKIQFDNPKTSHIPGWKLNKNQKSIPTPQKIKSIISQFKDLPKEAEKEIKTKDDMKKRIDELNKKNTIIQRELQHKQVDPQTLLKLQQSATRNVEIRLRKEYEPIVYAFKSKISKLNNLVKLSQTNTDNITKNLKLATDLISDAKVLEIKNIKTPTVPEVKTQSTITTPQNSTVVNSSDTETTDGETNGELKPTHKKILRAVAEWSDMTLTFKLVAFLSGYSPKSSSFRNPFYYLTSRVLLKKTGDIIKITQNGLDTLGEYEKIIPNHEDIMKHIMAKLKKPHRKILQAVDDAHPNSITFDDVAEAAVYSSNSSSFRNPFYNLTSLGLIIKNGEELTMSPELYPEEMLLQ